MVAGLDDLAVDLDQPLVDQPLHAVAGEVGDAVDEVLVDAAGEVLADPETEMLDIRAVVTLDARSGIVGIGAGGMGSGSSATVMSDCTWKARPNGAVIGLTSRGWLWAPWSAGCWAM